MFGITAIAGQGEYYIGLAAEDYYLGGGEPPGKWVGKGAKALGLSGRVEKPTFRNLLRGMDARDQPLVQNAGAESHRPGWDLTFSAPKSVSILWSQLRPQGRRILQTLQQRAVEAALGYLEAEAAWTRTGRNGISWQKVRLVLATFEHGTSRAQDPQLHTHCVLMNVGVREDGETSALETRPLYLHQHQADALYRADLAAGIERELGFRVGRKKHWFEVIGVPEDLIQRFSTRRRAILDFLRERRESGLSGDLASAEAREAAALATRESKAHVPRKELFRAWRHLGQEQGFRLGAIPRLSPEQRLDRARQTVQVQREALVRSLTLLCAEHASFRQRDLIRKLAQEVLGIGLDAGGVRGLVQAYLTDQQLGLGSGQRVVPLGPGRDREPRFTTRQVFALEERMLAAVSASRECGTPLSEWSVRAAELSRHLSREQSTALRALTLGPGSIQVLVGMAGSGKSFLLGAVREAYEREGYRVLGAALAGKAAAELETSAGIPSTTLHALLSTLGRMDPWVLGPRTVLVVDEAAMASNQQIARLVEATQRVPARLLLVGDPRQLQAIEQGGAFASIAGRLGAAELSTIRRQEGEDARWQQTAIQDFAAGRAQAALRAYEAHGRVTVTPTARQARRLAVADWETFGGAVHPAEHLLLAAKRADAEALNARAQALRARQGLLGREYLEVGEQRIHQGDRVLLTRNARLLGVRNGDLGTVDALSFDQNAITVRLDHGRQVRLDLSHYPHLALGYAITTHKGQGMTVRGNTYVLVGGAMQDLHLSYVQASRAKGQTRFYVERKDAGEELGALMTRMSRSRAKVMAHEVSLGEEHTVAS
ncbi:MAG: relaxase domain-containing protein [Candidatus Eisenbacteria bacterium]|nr:relaxase domain-containing protein [Candidatus Eisenbacteria bacterium]